MKQDWEMKQLVDVCNLFTDGNWIESKDQSIEGIRLIQTGNIRQGEYFDKSDKAKFISEETFKRLKCIEVLVGDILVSRLPEPVGRSCLIPDINSKMITAVDCTIIRTNEHLLPEFLRYYQLSNTYLKDVDSRTTGTTRSRISRKNLGIIEIPIPPFDEQKRIVAKLDECFEALDKARANVEKNLNNAKELFQSQLNQFFSQKGDGWVDITIGQLVNESIIEKPLDGNHGEIHPKKSDFVSSGIPFIMASDLQNGGVNTLDCNFITKEQADSLRKGFSKNGDVLLSHKGTIGRTAIHNSKYDYIVLTPQVTYYRVIDSKTLFNQYIYYFFQSPNFLNEMINYAKIGTTRAYIGITKQLQLNFNYPSLEYQKSIVNQLDDLKSQTESLESNYQQELDALDELKKSILQKAFNGEL